MVPTFATVKGSDAATPRPKTMHEWFALGSTALIFLMHRCFEYAQDDGIGSVLLSDTIRAYRRFQRSYLSAYGRRVQYPR